MSDWFDYQCTSFPSSSSVNNFVNGWMAPLSAAWSAYDDQSYPLGYTQRTYSMDFDAFMQAMIEYNSGEIDEEEVVSRMLVENLTGRWAGSLYGETSEDDYLETQSAYSSRLTAAFRMLCSEQSYAFWDMTVNGMPNATGKLYGGLWGVFPSHPVFGDAPFRFFARMFSEEDQRTIFGTGDSAQKFHIQVYGTDVTLDLEESEDQSEFQNTEGDTLKLYQYDATYIPVVGLTTQKNLFRKAFSASAGLIGDTISSVLPDLPTDYVFPLCWNTAMNIDVSPFLSEDPYIIPEEYATSISSMTELMAGLASRIRGYLDIPSLRPFATIVYSLSAASLPGLGAFPQVTLGLVYLIGKLLSDSKLEELADALEEFCRQVQFISAADLKFHQFMGVFYYQCQILSQKLETDGELDVGSILFGLSERELGKLAVAFLPSDQIDYLVKSTTMTVDLPWVPSGGVSWETVDEMSDLVYGTSRPAMGIYAENYYEGWTQAKPTFCISEDLLNYHFNVDSPYRSLNYSESYEGVGHVVPAHDGKCYRHDEWLNAASSTLQFVETLHLATKILSLGLTAESGYLAAQPMFRSVGTAGGEIRAADVDIKCLMELFGELTTSDVLGYLWKQSVVDNFLDSTMGRRASTDCCRAMFSWMDSELKCAIINIVLGPAFYSTYGTQTVMVRRNGLFELMFGFDGEGETVLGTAGLRTRWEKLQAVRIAVDDFGSYMRILGTGIQIDQLESILESGHGNSSIPHNEEKEGVLSEGNTQAITLSEELETVFSVEGTVDDGGNVVYVVVADPHLVWWKFMEIMAESRSNPYRDHPDVKWFRVEDCVDRDHWTSDFDAGSAVLSDDDLSIDDMNGGDAGFYGGTSIREEDVQNINELRNWGVERLLRY